MIGPVRLVNLTTHPVVVLDGSREVLRVPVDGRFARVRDVECAAGTLCSDGETVQVATLRRAQELVDLPAPELGTVFVVSRLTAAAALDRTDLVFPLDEVRGSAGEIIGCRRLGTFESGGAR